MCHSQHALADDAAPLYNKAQRLLAECRRILNARLSANTCLVGRCFAVEEEFLVRHRVMVLEWSNRPPSPQRKAELLEDTGESWSFLGGGVGFEACTCAAARGLQLAFPAAVFHGTQPRPLTGEERKETQAFVLRCVELMETAAAEDASGPCPRELVHLLHRLLSSDHLEQPFRAELNHACAGTTLQNALRARCLSDSDNEELAEASQKMVDLFDERQTADLAKHGLRWCALPSCAKQEIHVFDFKACSACKAVVYCSAEHGALHWTRGHRKKCAALKAAGAKPRSTADEGGAAV